MKLYATNLKISDDKICSGARAETRTETRTETRRKSHPVRTKGACRVFRIHRKIDYSIVLIVGNNNTSLIAG